MGRKKRAKPLFVLPLAICGAAVFMIKGVGEFYADAGMEETKKTQTIEESVTAESETEAEPEIKENTVAERKSVEAHVEYQSNISGLNCDEEESYLLAKIAMAEAESEGVKGKALVIMVVLNRVRSDKFPDSISEVIFQSGQFSPVASGRFDRMEPDQECYEALDMILLNDWDESQGALYFENGSTSDWHRNHLQFLFRYGNHYFYTE